MKKITDEEFFEKFELGFDSYLRDRPLDEKMKKKKSMLRAWWASGYITGKEATHKQYSWQPIETAPKDGTCVIGVTIIDGRAMRAQIVCYTDIGWYDRIGIQSWHFLTHWMPLPETPRSSNSK